MPISELEGIGVHEADKERLLEQFSLYLDGTDELPETASDPGSAEADLFSVFVELAAVRNEVRAESRLVKEALDQFRGVFDTLQSSHATLQQELLRAQGEVRERSQAVLRPLLSDLLELRDRLEAALQQPAAPPQRSWLGLRRQPSRAEPETWRQGIGIMARRLDRILSDRRVSRLELVGQLFDPRTARAVGTRQDGRFGPGIVVEEVRAGYLWDNDLLRTAEVIVSKADEGEDEP
jgi:molecular chaperone GrpE